MKRTLPFQHDCIALHFACAVRSPACGTALASEGLAAGTPIVMRRRHPTAYRVTRWPRGFDAVVKTVSPRVANPPSSTLPAETKAAGRRGPGLAKRPRGEAKPRRGVGHLVSLRRTPAWTAINHPHRNLLSAASVRAGNRDTLAGGLQVFQFSRHGLKLAVAQCVENVLAIGVHEVAQKHP
jgi:hypothetical protein